MSIYLSSSKLDKIHRWLSDIHSGSKPLPGPLHPVIQDLVDEAPPNMAEMRLPVFDYNRARSRKPIAHWKSEKLSAPTRHELALSVEQIRDYCNRTGLNQAFRPELNTVESMASLPTHDSNELVTESKSVLRNEFIRVLQIRNSFYAEQYIFTALLRQPNIGAQSRTLYEMRRSECQYGCQKAHAAADYIRSYASHLELSIDFLSLESLHPYPETKTIDAGGGEADANVDTLMNRMTSSLKCAAQHKRKQAISDTEFKDWKDRWVFQANNRTTRHPGNF